MKIKFLSDAEVEELTKDRRGQHRNMYNWSAIIEELYKHPNRWAEMDFKVPSATTRRFLLERFKDIEVRMSGGNNLASSHPDKKLWSVYIKYVPAVDATEEEETF